MAKARVAELTVEDEREITSETLAKGAVAPASHRARVGSRTATFGEIDLGKAAGRPQDRRYDSLVESMKMRHDATGIRPGTVLNFLPIPLTVNSPMQSLKVRVPAAYGAKDFTAYTWDEADIQVLYAGEGINQPWDYMPVQLARAYEEEYREQGGVIAFSGEVEDIENDPKLLARIADAKEHAYAWMHRKVEEGSAEWNSPNRQNARNITQLHRDCAQKLHDLRLLPELPEWIQTIRKPENVPTACKSCGTTPDNNSVKCRCGYIIDPARAFTIGDISEESEALERLTREEVEKLGVSAYVAETIDERTERLKAGLPKPLSLAAQRALSAQQQYEDARHKKG